MRIHFQKIIGRKLARALQPMAIQLRATGNSHDGFDTGAIRALEARRPPSSRGSFAERSSHFPVKVTRKEMKTTGDPARSFVF